MHVWMNAGSVRVTGSAAVKPAPHPNNYQATGSDLMNSHLNYLMATGRAADLKRYAEQARLAKADRTLESTVGRGGLTARTFASLRLWVAGSQRLRARRT
jgi:hypothetical protein